MSTAKNLIEKAVFAVLFLFSETLMYSDNLSGLWKNEGGTLVIFLKLTISLSLSFIGAQTASKHTEFVSRFVMLSGWGLTGLLIFDYYVTHLSGSQFLFSVWWIAAITVSCFGVFLSVTITSTKEYEKHFRRICIGCAPLYLFTLIICFLRTPFAYNRTVNKELFGGTFLMLKAFINNPDGTFEAPLIFFGNLLIFLPLPFILKALFRKIKSSHLLLAGALAPVFAEGYQYVFECGDVDIDDILLNWFGFLVGYVILKLILRKKQIDEHPQ